MRLLCGPVERVGSGTSSGALPVVLYDAAKSPQVVSIGAAVLRRVHESRLSIAPRAWDLLSIALSVVAADASVHRRLSPDGWTRQFDLRVCVGDHEFWSTQKCHLERLLRFLTTDIWNVEFVSGGFYPPRRLDLSAVRPSEDCVCLLSGGLDSLIGASDLAASGENLHLVSQVVRGDTGKQGSFSRVISNGLPRLELNHNVRCPWPQERSQRTRSVVLLAYGVLMATALAQYHNGGVVTLYVCENGFISINPALTTTRVGSLSTRTTHPLFMRGFQEVLDEARLRVRIVNPYQFRTKGEMLQDATDQRFLVKHAATSTSCGRFARFGYRHCGRCVPCVIRRAAFSAWGVPDTTGYVYEDLARSGGDHAGFDDVRAFAVAVAEAQGDDFQRWIRARLNVPSADAAPYRKVVQRGLTEVSDFLDIVGVT